MGASTWRPHSAPGIPSNNAGCSSSAAAAAAAQGPNGYWKLADQAERLLKLLWEPMDRAYERLARPPEFWKYKDD